MQWSRTIRKDVTGNTLYLLDSSFTLSAVRALFGGFGYVWMYTYSNDQKGSGFCMAINFFFKWCRCDEFIVVVFSLALESLLGCIEQEPRGQAFPQGEHYPVWPFFCFRWSKLHRKANWLISSPRWPTGCLPLEPLHIVVSSVQSPHVVRLAQL